MKVMQNSKIIQKFNDFIFSRLKNSQRNIEVRNFFLNKFTVSNNFIHRFFISRNKFESNQLDLTTFLELEEGWERNAVYLSPWKLRSFTPSEQPFSFSFFFFVHLGGNSRCLRRFLVRRLEGNRRTIFSSTLPGGEVGQTQKKTIQRNAYLCGEGVKKKGEAGFIQGSNYPWRNEGGRKTVWPGSRVFTGRAAYIISIPRPPPPKKAKRVDVA